ncbi:DUF6090 family protein [Altibacter sp.]|uniref:DUF6090 family protein n=1 Tax=Altibacter sp. TaxID=2024823 RepID=UPI000C8FB1A2|nr:DUF6090 family protein [Altibacter sp.]MAP55212.1 hypothetical protein [Altibacter sp.]
MIKFFRNIRYKLLGESRFGRYLAYAIGEIILVVIGILIALQINTWNEHRKAQVTENTFYEEILLDLEKDEKKLVYYKRFCVKRIAYLDTLLTYVRNPQKTMGIDKFGRYVEPIFYSEQPTIYDATFESAKAAGTFNVISDKILLKNLAEYYSDFMQVRNNFSSLERFIENQFEPMMYSLPEGYMNENTGDLVINQSDVTGFYKKIASIKDNRNIDYDYKDILNYPRMENYIIGDLGRTFNVLGKIEIRQQKLKQLKQNIKDRD